MRDEQTESYVFGGHDGKWVKLRRLVNGRPGKLLYRKLDDVEEITESGST